jgi:isopentenyl phosphate kinase
LWIHVLQIGGNFIQKKLKKQKECVKTARKKRFFCEISKFNQSVAFWGQYSSVSLKNNLPDYFVQ